MHAFYENLRYAFLTKFDQQISDMTAVIVLKFNYNGASFPMQFE